MTNFKPEISFCLTGFNNKHFHQSEGAARKSCNAHQIYCFLVKSLAGWSD